MTEHQINNRSNLLLLKQYHHTTDLPVRELGISIDSSTNAFPYNLSNDDLSLSSENSMSRESEIVDMEMSFGQSITDSGIFSPSEDMASDSIDDSRTSELDSSQELTNTSLLWGTTPPQNGKRCGIIFVDETTHPIPSPNWRGSNDDKTTSFLVVRGRASNIWSFAKGRMKNETESEEECALREVLEETGIELLTIKGLPRIVIGRNVYFILKTSKEVFSSFSIMDNYEVGEVAWKTCDELRKLICNKDIRAVLRYPKRVFPYHRIIYSIISPLPTRPLRTLARTEAEPILRRVRYSFQNVRDYLESDEILIEV